MAVMMSPATPITQLMNQPMSLVEFGGSRRMSSSSISSSIGEISPVARVIDEKIYVAVGKTFDKSKSAVVWALQNSGGKKICVLHVHQPAQMIPLLGAKFEASTLKEREVKAYRDIQRGKMHKVLAEYLRLCGRVGVRAEAMVIEKESIEEGILELISKHGIKKLVMGAADNSRYYKNMTNLKSKKAIFVKEQAPAACHIWFVCKSHLIHTRHAILHQDDESASSQPQGSSSIRTGNFSRSHSVYVKPSNPIQDLFKKAPSLNLDARFSGGREMLHTMPDGTRAVVTPPRSDAEESSYVNEPRRSTSHGSVLSSSSSGGMANLAIVPSTLTEGSDVAAEMSTFPEITDNLCHTSPPSVPEITVVDPLYEQLKRTMEESIFSEREALEEATRRAKAEKNTIEAIHRVKALESLYAEESKQRKDIERAIAREREELAIIINNQDKVTEELRLASNHKCSLETQIDEADRTATELEQKIFAAVELLQKYNKEREELQVERDDALREAEELRRSRAETEEHQRALNLAEELQTKLAEHASTLQLLTMFSLAEIDEATDGFNESNKIGVGGYGTIYKGFICHTAVAVKVLNRDSMQGAAEFQQEVNVLGKLRHPNLVTLIGACQESYALIYEYMPNGNLEDRLNCKNDTPPLPWQARIRLATELCSVLIFLHSSKPNSIVHGDLKPANILLDANLGCKLSDFGICRALAPPGSGNNATLFHITDPKGTFHYLDPHFLTTGELSPKSDTYSFGIILLQLLSGKPALGIANETRLAMNEGSLSFLDQSAGDWPFLQAKQLARLGLACCDMDRSRRPDLASDVRRVLERMRGLWVSSSLTWSGSRHQPPSHFYCPILQDVMVDPHVAADGFTYEVEALRGWFEGGHVTSPMTNLELDNFDLVPNRSLRSAIQEWLQR
ncbi:U-box domain-containing protein 33 [Linum grandiflorum]